MQQWLKLHFTKVGAFFFWIAMIALIYYKLDASDQTLKQFLLTAEYRMTTEWYGALTFLALFAVVRPFTLLPTMIFLALGGRIFGLGWGFIYGTIGMTASALIPYYTGRLFQKDVPDGQDGGPVKRFIGRMAQFLRMNAFEALVMMRMTHIPYDMVSFTAGGLSVPFRTYLLGTFLGNLPATYPFVALGASIEGSLFDGNYVLNQALLISSVVVFGLCVAISKSMRRRDFKLENVVKATQEMGAQQFERMAQRRADRAAARTRDS